MGAIVVGDNEVVIFSYFGSKSISLSLLYGTSVFPAIFGVVGLGTHSGLSYNKGKLFSLVEGWGDKLVVSGVTTQIAVSHGNNFVVGH